MKKIALALVATSLVSFNSHASQKVVYGDDNRVDVFASTNSMYVELSKSTAAMISGSSIKKSSNGEVSIKGRSLEARGMCKSERFSSQKSAANCSGFLVGENLLVTAGHCIKSQSSCNSYKWVFDYKVEFEDQFDFKVPATSVYSCKRIIKTVLDRGTMDDYALIELDRKVTDRRVLDFRTSGKPAVGDKLVVIGRQP